MATRPSATRSSSNPSVPNPGQPAMPPTGSRAKLVAELLRRAGWRNHQVVRNWPLAASPADDRREHHHGARDDRVAYVLCAQPGVPTAVIATVGAQHGPEVALSRAARQAKRLDAAFAYATNGRQTVRHFPSSGRVVEVDELSNPTSAWRAFARLHALRGRSAVLLGQRYDQDALGAAGGAGPRAPALPLRYYQLIAANRCLMAWNRGDGRAALALPGGVGATVTATAAVAKLLTNRLTRHIGQPFGVLWLDDRPTALTGLGALGTTARWGEDGETYLALRTLGASLEDLPVRPPDLVVVNLAHGGTALDPTLWTDVLQRFEGAFRLGLVDSPLAAPSAIRDWLGRPIFRYTKGQARSDGYLSTPQRPPVPEADAPEELTLGG